ncbi:MAG: HAD family phosphatase [Alloprevotella sp.]|nr:HAD family phosphatase [Alloprevotella sp.]
MIQTIIFDMGGVLITIDHAEAVRRFTQIGIREAATLLDPYTQGGPFGALEQGDISPDEFVREMSRLAGRTLSRDECAYGWLGYAKDAPQRNYELLARLRHEGYRLILLSNMNPFINAWLENAYTLPEALSPAGSEGLWPRSFPPGRPLSSYFDACYRSFEIRMMKPDPRIFSLILKRENILPEETLLVDDGPRNCAAAKALGLHALQPENGKDWTQELARLLPL